MKKHASNSEGGSKGKRPHWSMGLLNCMADPKMKVKEDDLIVAITDGYPKAHYHYLILPKEDINTIYDLKREHEDLLTHMENIAEDLIKNHPDHEFKFGYHAKPSMQRLHLHVISLDFDSPYLKTKHHWNSFTTDIFCPAKEVHEELRRNGFVKRMTVEEYQKLLNTELKCHKCSERSKNMPGLKRHLRSHISSKD
ncbi:aprataxin [Cephus cinctus]|uniref:Aprataxin n=1 Tax=Cephus cinctus TaxID=211228 RepID=A0AAJ7FFG2_CEPCN|nr:aprataxin [Cephus cinctus]XP_015589196.1 aprataxin [Cephus cinctus]